MNKKKVTMQDIADSLHISKVTVHKALNNQSGVGEELRTTIIQKSIELNYKQIDPLIKYCRSFYFVIHKKYTFSYEQFFMNIYSHLQKLLTNVGGMLTLVSVDNNFDAKKFVARLTKSKEVSSLFLVGELPDFVYEEITAAQIPSVCIDYSSSRYVFDYIFVDNYRASFALTDYVIKLGHKNPCFIISSKSNHINMDKYYGFRKALFVNNIKFLPEMNIDVDIMDSKAFSEMKFPEKLPSVFMCDSDQAANYLMMKLQTLGYKIPDDVSVTGYDNNEIGKEAYPTITTIGTSKLEIAQAAYNIMLERLSHPKRSFITESLRPKIYQRDSLKSLLPN